MQSYKQHDLNLQISVSKVFIANGVRDLVSYDTIWNRSYNTVLLVSGIEIFSKNFFNS